MQIHFFTIRIPKILTELSGSIYHYHFQVIQEVEKNINNLNYQKSSKILPVLKVKENSSEAFFMSTRRRSEIRPAFKCAPETHLFQVDKRKSLLNFRFHLSKSSQSI